MKIERTVVGTNGRPTFGTMTMASGLVIGVTLERPADDPDHPCIPAGIYTVNQAMHHPDTPGEYKCPELDTSHLVPVRTNIQIHILNTASESEGCIGPGLNIGADGVSIEHSGLAFSDMMRAIAGNFPFTLEILDP